MALAWNPPRRDGGSPVTGYVIEMKEVHSTVWKKVAQTSCNGSIITMLQMPTVYVMPNLF